MGWAFGTPGGEDSCIQGFGGETLRVREHCVTPLGADGIIIDLQQVEWVEIEWG